MQVVIIEHKANGGATWSAHAIPEDLDPRTFAAMGHRVVTLTDKESTELLKQMAMAVGLQFKLRELYYREAEGDLK